MEENIIRQIANSKNTIDRKFFLILNTNKLNFFIWVKHLCVMYMYEKNKYEYKIWREKLKLEVGGDRLEVEDSKRLILIIYNY